MPEHTSFFSYLVAMFPALGHNMEALGHTVFGKPVDAHKAEPLLASAFVVLIIAVLGHFTKKMNHGIDIQIAQNRDIRGFIRP